VPGVFEPHSDSWLLARHLVQEHPGEQANVLDLCTGSGMLAVLAASRAGCNVVAIDVARRAVLATRINAKLNGVTVRAVRGNLFAPIRGTRFDLIVSNPPYLPSPDGELPRQGRSRAWEAGPSGRAFIDRICAEAPAHLNPGGTLLLVHSSVCGERETVAALRKHGLQTNVVARSIGPLGPRLRSRAEWLLERGLARDGQEEMLVVRAQQPTRRELPHPARPHADDARFAEDPGGLQCLP
jgi:release factor glutamine methyltransferase